MSPWEASCYAGSAVEPILKQTLRDMRFYVRGATTALAIAAVMALSACGGTIGGNKQTIGTVVVAAGGGLLRRYGARLVGTGGVSTVMTRWEPTSPKKKRITH